MIETGEIYHISQNGAPTGHELWSDRPVKISDMSFFRKSRGQKYREHIALCSQIHTVDKCRLESCYGKVSSDELKEIETTVKQTLF